MQLSELNDESVPRVSIGMLVYNGGALLEQALDSLVAQEYRDFELIISDNASTDTTESVCREYASRDPRIRYIRRDKNYGASNNAFTALRQSRGDFFMFAAHDDRWHPQFILECVKALEQNPQVVLAMPAVQFLSPDDGSFCDNPYPPLHTVGLGLRSKVAAIFNETEIGYNFYGLYRRQALMEITQEVDCYGWDVIMLMYIVLCGDVVHIPQKLFYYRLSRKTVKDHLDLIKAQDKDNYTSKPYTSLTINLFRVIINADVTPSLKRIMLSDALEIIAVKNVNWRNAILAENRTLLPYVNPDENGFGPTPALNCIALFAVLLLPRYVTGGSCGSTIDFTEIQSFDTIPVFHRKPPVPGQKEFIGTLTYLAEHNKTGEMLSYYERYRNCLPDTENLVQIDTMMQRLQQ